MALGRRAKEMVAAPARQVNRIKRKFINVFQFYFSSMHLFLILTR